MSEKLEPELGTAKRIKVASEYTTTLSLLSSSGERRSIYDAVDRHGRVKGKRKNTDGLGEV